MEDYTVYKLNEKGEWIEDMYPDGGFETENEAKVRRDLWIENDPGGHDFVASRV